MSKQCETRRLVEHQGGVNVGRRNILKLTGVGVAVHSMMSVDPPAFAQSTLAWDQTFPKSERVDHRKVSFYKRLGITLVADLYIPKNIDRSRRHRERIGVIAVCGSGGFGLAAAEIAPRIKAVATVSMYDIGQAKRQGLARSAAPSGRRKSPQRSCGCAVPGQAMSSVITVPAHWSSSTSRSRGIQLHEHRTGR